MKLYKALRCTSIKFANAFVNRGSIKFNTPQFWVEEEERRGKGRGDVLEGTFASCYCYDILHINEIINKYQTSDNDVFEYIKDNRLYFKRHSTMILPAFCLYALKEDAFKFEQKEGWKEGKKRIPGSYFQDFFGKQTQDEIAQTPEEDRPAVIIIRDYEMFKTRLIKKLISTGIAQSEIKEYMIQYYDFSQFGQTGWFEFPFPPPNELAIKSKDFERHCEHRFVIDSINKKQMDNLRKNTIEIGPLTDIATVVPGCFQDGLDVEIAVF